MTEPRERHWRNCSTCKKPIGWGATHWVCSVSTCNQKRTGLAFCSVSCWDAHVPVMRHKDAWAVERQAPEAPRQVVMNAGERPPIAAVGAPNPEQKLESAPPKEVLVVASKVKAYIKARSGLNTSAAVMDALSEQVRRICDQAIRSAWQHERKTVLDRDVPE